MARPFYDWDAAPPPPTIITAPDSSKRSEHTADQTRVFDPAFTLELGALLTDEADIPTLDDNPVVDATGAPVSTIPSGVHRAPNYDRPLKRAIGTVFCAIVAVGAAAVASGILTSKEPAATVAPAEATTSTTYEQPVATTATTLPQPRVVIAAETPATPAVTYAPTTSTTAFANRPAISIDVPALINEALQAAQSTTNTTAERATTTTAPTTTTSTPVSTTRPAPTSTTTVPTLPNSSPVSTR